MAAAKIHDDVNRVQLYSKQLLAIVRKEFSKRNINIYDYERFINVLTCLNLQVDEIKDDVNTYINRKTDRHIDIKI